MNVSAPFIVRPIATTLLMIGVTLLGLVADFILPIAGVPQVDVPTIRVSASLPGANAETMATSVAAPLETQLALISGVTSISLHEFSRLPGPVAHRLLRHLAGGQHPRTKGPGLLADQPDELHTDPGTFRDTISRK
jgi:hypothetical protein